MDAVSALSTIYKDKFENTYIYQETKNGCFFYTRYIGNTFIIHPGGLAKLNNFLTNQNMMNDSMKFDHKTFTHSIAFLNNRIHINKNVQLQPILYTKPTNTRNYLQYRSSHPKHLKDSLS